MLLNGKYELWLPEHRAARPEWKTGWEVKRIDEMVKTIKSSDILFDIGTEEGDITAIIQKETGCDIVMFEPNKNVFGCITSIWRGNNLKNPIDFYYGFASDKTNSQSDYRFFNPFNMMLLPILPAHGHKQLYEKDEEIDQIRLDDYCKLTNIYPTVITMDVEGAEFLVMQGAKEVLRTAHPKVFMSVHPEFMNEHYKHHVGDMLKYMHDLDYEHELIAYDYHELHIMFQ